MSNRPNVSHSLGYLSQFFIVIGLILFLGAAFQLLIEWLGPILFNIEGVSADSILNKTDPTNTEINFIRFTKGFGNLVFLLVAIAATIGFREPITEYINIHKVNNKKAFSLSILLLLCAIPFNSFLINWGHLLFGSFESEFFKKAAELNEQIFTVMLTMNNFSDLLIMLFITGLIPALGEEFLFRGVLLNLFKRWTGNSHIAIIISSVLFGLMHFQISNLIALIFMGMILGYTVHYTKTIWTGVVLHFINNSLVVIITYISASGELSDSILNDNFPLYLSIISLILSAGIFYVIWKNRTIEKEITIEIE